MLRNTYLCGNKMFTNKVNAASFGVGKEKEVALIKKVELRKQLQLRFIKRWSQWTRYKIQNVSHN